MKTTPALSTFLVISALCGFGCGSNPAANNANKTATTVNSNTINPAANTSNATGTNVNASAIPAGSPTETVKKYFDSAGSADINGMTKLFSEKKIRERTAAKLKEDCQSFSKVAQQLVQAKTNPTIFKINEVVTDDTAIVNFTYGNASTGSGLKSKCRLVKEKGEWKIEELSENR